MATDIKGPLSGDAQRVTGEALQRALVDLVDLALLGKQAHWNLTGRNFRSVHLQLDEVVALAREHMDVLAERAVAIGCPPDGRARTVADASGLPELDAGWLTDDAAVRHFVEILGTAVGRVRAGISATEDADPVTQDLLIATAADLEKQYWMFQAQQ